MSMNKHIGKEFNFADYQFFAVETLTLGTGCLTSCTSVTFAGIFMVDNDHAMINQVNDDKLCALMII